MKAPGSLAAPLTPIVIDVETTMKCPVGNNKANPFWPENTAVLWGVKNLESGAVALTNVLNRDAHDYAYFLIGHNIAFDLHYALQSKVIVKTQLARMQIWDTQLAEYLLSGQQQRYPTLDYCAAKRGGTLKDEKVGVMFKSGMGADAVPPGMLATYLRDDLSNTEKVFWSQYAEAEERGMLPLIWSQMDARLATIEMIHNGLAVDKAFLERRIEELTASTQLNARWLQGVARADTGHPLDPTKPRDLSLFLFGGVYKTQAREKVGTYKNGKDKLKWVETEHVIKGLHTAPTDLLKDQYGYYLTPDAVLEELGGIEVGVVQAYRENTKQLSTYFEGIHKLIMPDGLVHHNLNHVVTVTGRLSGSDPNLQNVTDGKKGDIKKAFVSRWGDEGVIVEADYSQLEMVMLAVLSNDLQMQEDIRNGVDMHNALYESMYGRKMDPLERTLFKRRSFALVYGAGATGIATQAGITKAEAKRFIDTFYARYTGVQEWHTRMAIQVDAGREYLGDKDKETGLPTGRSTYISPFSKRRYVFKEYPLSPEVKKWKGKDVGFSPTEIKNYPVQGSATADIVPLILGKLFRVLRNNPRLADKCLMINTVHDSVLFDVHKTVVHEAIEVIEQVMQDAPRYIKEQWDYDFPLDLKVGVKAGPNWLDQTDITKREISSALLKEAA